MRNSFGKRKNGFTLFELCIVMGLLALVATMIVSVCLFVDARVKIISTRNNANLTREDCSSFFRTWVSAYDSSDYLFSVSEDGHDLNVSRAESPDVPYRTLRHFDDLLIGSFAENNKEWTDIRSATDVTFRVFPEDGKNMVACLLIYKTCSGDEKVVVEKNEIYLKTLYAATAYDPTAPVEPDDPDPVDPDPTEPDPTEPDPTEPDPTTPDDETPDGE